MSSFCSSKRRFRNGPQRSCSEAKKFNRISKLASLNEQSLGEMVKLPYNSDKVQKSSREL